MKLGLEIGCVALYACAFLAACSNSEGYSCAKDDFCLEYYSVEPSLVYETVEVTPVPVEISVLDDDSTLAKDDELKVSVASLDSAKCVAIRTTKNDFVPLENVLSCVGENEKVAFIVRHGARELYESGTEDHLNEIGVMQAFRLGEKLKDFPDFYYMHSYYIRTMETAYYVAEGKGQKVEAFTRENSDTLVHEMLDDLLYSWYVKDYAYEYVCSPNGGLASLTKMAYEPEDYYCNLGFYNAKERTLELVKKYFTYEKMHDVTFAVSHDFFVAPMVIAITDGEIGMDYYNHPGDDYYWPNFLSGAAVIVDDKDNVTMVPVKGLESGRLNSEPIPETFD